MVEDSVTDRRFEVQLEHRTLGIQIADSLRLAIRNGQFEVGEEVSESRLAEQLNVSRATVREALRVLTAEGLLDKEPRKTWRIRRVAPHTVWEVATARAGLEGAAAYMVVQAHCDEAKTLLGEIVDQMQSAADSKEYDAFGSLDLHFHRSILELSGNRVLLELWLTVYAISDLVEGCPEASNLSMQEIVLTHRKILNAMLSGNPELAESVTKNQIIESYGHLDFKGYPEPWSRDELGV